MLGEAMSELGNEIIGKTDSAELADENITESGTISTTPAFVSDSAADSSNLAADSTRSSGVGNKRRGVWKRVRVRPVDGFETAESQNYGSRIYNSIAAGSAKEQLNKANSDKGAFHSFNLDHTLVDESEQPHRDQSETTDASLVQVTSEATMISTASSPGDVDLGTGAPVLTTIRSVTINESRSDSVVLASTVESRFETTSQPERSDEIETESTPSEDQYQDHEQAAASATFTTVTSTRRYDVGDDLMMEDDHTEFPFSYEPFGSNADTTVNEHFNTESAPTATAEPAFYDDYDSEFRTVASVSAMDSTGTKPDEKAATATSSLMSDVKQKLSELFSFGSEDYDYGETNAVRPADVPMIVKQQQYSTIERAKPTSEVSVASSNIVVDDVKSLKEDGAMNAASTTTESSAAASTSTTTKSFHRNLMDSVIYATSTSTEVSHETEICYRGRCIKTEKKLH